MSVINPNETARSWAHRGRVPTVRLFLGESGPQFAELAGAQVGGFAVDLAGEHGAPIDASQLIGADAALIEIAAGDPKAIAQFEKLARSSEIPLVAAAFDPPLSLVRALVRAGAHDVIPLPLDPVELDTALRPLSERIAKDRADTNVRRGRLVSVIKAVGGVGATAVATQLAIRFAGQETMRGREACFIDFDVQFGDAAFQLGLRPKLSLADLLRAGRRLDGDLVRSTVTAHSSGLQLIAAPPTMMPLESLASEQVLEIVEQAGREFGTIFVDLPTNWTNWSLSLIARSDIVLLVTELNVASLNRARRQLDLLAEQQLGDLEVRVIVNRHEKGLLKGARSGAVREALGREPAYNVANDHPLVRAAIDRGVPIDDVKRKSAVARDLDALDAGLAASLGLDR